MFYHKFQDCKIGTLASSLPDNRASVSGPSTGSVERVAGVCSGVVPEVRLVRGFCHDSLRALGCHTSSSKMVRGKVPKRRGLEGSSALEKVLPIRMPCRL